MYSHQIVPQSDPPAAHFCLPAAKHCYFATRNLHHWPWIVKNSPSPRFTYPLASLAATLPSGREASEKAKPPFKIIDVLFVANFLLSIIFLRCSLTLASRRLLPLRQDISFMEAIFNQNLSTIHILGRMKKMNKIKMGDSTQIQGNDLLRNQVSCHERSYF